MNTQNVKPILRIFTSSNQTIVEDLEEIGEKKQKDQTTVYKNEKYTCFQKKQR